ncbi:hypothetical protein [Nocardioides daphniae]|uniref:Uncharacterized protein n=1 Tax=Nocardioides daphniae TaxID=402297 RepID=A0A4P7UA71_9ACTN|nr:hypothetical protein [Nocardioides daphniae]QCC76501.1 hypothetical protein E2C04_03415 [Nocardioides daphniae]GGD06096.1 hypothetical protein GCM10007231_01010 [Nocardioides daphniae]
MPHQGSDEPEAHPHSPFSASGEPSYWDRLAAELQQVRASLGNPSYVEIAQRITDRRVAAGVRPEAARVARTIVYDAFRTGRKRMDRRCTARSPTPWARARTRWRSGCSGPAARRW